MQRALMQYRNPANYDLVKEALHIAKREDLIGFDKNCLIKPRQFKKEKEKYQKLKPGNKNAGKKKKGNKNSDRKNAGNKNRNVKKTINKKSSSKAAKVKSRYK
jgi:hypothetical protein